MTDEEYTRKTFESHVGPTAGSMTVTAEEASLVRKVLATTGYTAPMHERHEARRIVDRLLPPMPDTGRGRGMPLAFGDAANC